MPKIKNLASMPKTILQRVNELRTVLQEKDDQAKQHRGPTGPSFGYTGGIQTRTMKLDFPHFDGTNPSGWLFKAKQYFAYHQVPVEQWLTVASLNMNADALEWYQWYMEYKPKASWEDFVAAMDSRFGPPRSEDYAGKLSKLRQTSTVIQYQQEFQRLSNRVRGLSEAYLISLYLSGLRDEIRIGVHKMNPSSLPDAFSLARLQEEEANLRRRVWRPEVGKQNLAETSTATKPTAPTIKRLTPAEARARREKGLCYNCDEQYTPGHRCKIHTFLG